MLLLFPLVVTRLATAEIAVWYLLTTIIALQQLADLGFAPTFARVIAYATGGAQQLGDLRAVTAPGNGEPNWPLVGRIWGTMRVIYWRLTIGSVALLALLGTPALVRPIGALDRPSDGWIAWALILLVSVITLRGNAYAAYLQGLNHVALVRRWEAITTLGAILTSSVVLLVGGRLVALVAVNQSWMLVNVFRDWQLTKRANGGVWQSFRERRVDPATVAAVWPSAWRSGVGISFARGLVFASSLIYAQVANAAALATYLIAFRLIQVVADFANAPFYSKLPLLSRLRSEGRGRDQIATAERGMRLAYWTYAAAFVAIGITARPALQLIGSNAAWATPALWGLLGVAFFAERFGAMHLQLYSTTNHIIWHVAAGVMGTIYLAVSLLLIGPLGVLAFPIGVLAGHLGFYGWYSALHVYRTFDMNFLAFQRRTIFIPLVVVLVYTGLSLTR